MAENYPHLMKYINLQIQQAKQITNRINIKKITSRKIIFKLLIIKNNKKFLESVQNKRYDIRRKAK